MTWGGGDGGGVATAKPVPHLGHPPLFFSLLHGRYLPEARSCICFSSTLCTMAMETVIFPEEAKAAKFPCYRK